MRLIVSFLFTLSLLGNVNALGFTPDEGLYFPKKLIVPTTPNICKFWGEVIPPLAQIALTGEKSFDLAFAIEWEPGEIVPYLTSSCAFKGSGHGFGCQTEADISDFNEYGFDAVMRVEGEKWDGAFSNSKAFHFIVAQEAKTSCTGPDCDALASAFFGPDFKWGCKISPKGYRFEK